MTSVVTVSASTAAFALEPLKPSARVSGSAAQESMKALTLEAKNRQAQHNHIKAAEVGPAALTLFFLTAGQQQKSLQQATFEQAEDAYLEQRYETGERCADDGEREEDREAEDEEGESEHPISPPPLLDEFGMEQTELLALPSPEGLE